MVLHIHKKLKTRYPLFIFSTLKPYLYILLFLLLPLSVSAQTDTVKVGDGKDIDLREVVVKGHVSKVVLRKDTFVYNAAAYHMPEASAAGELVKRLPGAEVTEDGQIRINGKSISKIRINGKDFMDGDLTVALNNLPSSAIQRIKAYDRKNGQSRLTGIDDGEEQTILDFVMKEGDGLPLKVNANFSYGSHDRYSERLAVGYFNGGLKVWGIAAGNNVGDASFPGGGGIPNFESTENGQISPEILGTNINYQIPDKLKLTANVRWNHRRVDERSQVSGQNFLGTADSYVNSVNRNLSRGDGKSGRIGWRWDPNGQTTVQGRFVFEHSCMDEISRSDGATFHANPYDHTTDPMGSLAQLDRLGILVNTDSLRSLSYAVKDKYTGMAVLNRLFGTKGRGVMLRGDFSYTDGDQSTASTANTRYTDLLQQAVHTRRYTTLPTSKQNYKMKGVYTEPIFPGVGLQLAYTFQYATETSDRTTYRYDKVPGFSSWNPSYRGWTSFLSHVSQPYDAQYRDEGKTRYSAYRHYTHDANLLLQHSGKDLQLTAGMMVQQQTSHFNQEHRSVQIDTVRSVVNLAPMLDILWYIRSASRLRITYHGTTTQPSMADLLAITDDSDPLHITKGNPGLKSSFHQQVQTFYNGYTERHSQSWMFNVGFGTTARDVSQFIIYDEDTGTQTILPINIDGNYETNAAVMYNANLDHRGDYAFNAYTNFSYANLGSTIQRVYQQPQNNVTRSLVVSERIAFTYRGGWVEIEPGGSFIYQRVSNLLQPDNNRGTWGLSPGINVNLKAPWGTGVSSDFHVNSRRGYENQALNNTEVVWNVQLSQRFKRAPRLTLLVDAYDVLRQQSTLSRIITSAQYSDAAYNNINSYILFHVIYRLNM